MPPYKIIKVGIIDLPGTVNGAAVAHRFKEWTWLRLTNFSKLLADKLWPHLVITQINKTSQLNSLFWTVLQRTLCLYDVNARPVAERLMHGINVSALSRPRFALSTRTQADSTLLKSRGEGVKSFSCIKEGPAYPRVLFLETRTRYAHMHTWQTNIIIFRVPCRFPLFTIERFVVGAKNGERRERTRDTTAASFVALLIVREASSGVISSHTVSPCPLVPKWFCPSDWLPNALRQRVLITLLPVNGDDGSIS